MEVGTLKILKRGENDVSVVLIENEWDIDYLKDELEAGHVILPYLDYNYWGENRRIIDGREFLKNEKGEHITKLEVDGKSAFGLIPLGYI